MQAPQDGPVWAEVEWTVLEPQERADTAPADTRALPYRARARGLAAAPVVGAEADVSTPGGRQIHGTVVDVQPGYAHTFGRPLPEWVVMKEAIRQFLADHRRSNDR